MNLTELVEQQLLQLGQHDSKVHAPDEDNGVLIAKVTAMCVLFLASTFFGCLPFALSSWFKWAEGNVDARSNLVVSSLLNFGGGALLATTFIHLQPEIAEIIDDLQHEGVLPDFRFSLAPFLMCCGFFIIYFVEEMVHLYLHRHQKRLEKENATEAFVRSGHGRDSILVKRARKHSETRNGSISTADLITNDAESHREGHENGKTLTPLPEIQIVPTQAAASQGACAETGAQPATGHHHHNHLPVYNPADDTLLSSCRGMLIVLALSVHELFEGLAVGLEGEVGNVWYMFGAVSAHKLVIAFCIGVELVAIRTRRSLAIVYVLTFAVVSPVGIGVGIALTHSENSDAYAVPSVVLQGLASGTLLYVIFFEVLSTEKSGLVQYLATVVGFFLMFAFQFIGEHEHSHGGEGEHNHEHLHSGAAKFHEHHH